jgi:hypothetical protein
MFTCNEGMCSKGLPLHLDGCGCYINPEPIDSKQLLAIDHVTFTLSGQNSRCRGFAPVQPRAITLQAERSIQSGNKKHNGAGIKGVLLPADIRHSFAPP